MIISIYYLIISILTFIIYNILVKTVNLQRAPEIKPRISGNTTLLYFLLACAVSVAFFQTSYAQTSPQGQNTLSDNLLNDPLAQDLLKKIEQTKKMIADLEQKEYEKSQAQEHLQQMREMSLERLNNNLDEWERLWEKQSSRNSFESFVNKKPEYVQGVFWDQFEFKEQKVNAGRIAMMQVLANGGTIQDAKEAYNKAATSKRVEIRNMGLNKISKKDMETARKVLSAIVNNTEEFIQKKGERVDPDLWNAPQDKSQKTLVKL